MEYESEILELTDQIRQIAYDLHVYLRHGHMEKVYENGLATRLKKIGLRTEQQYPLRVRDENGTLLGDYYADLFVENRIIIELKRIRRLRPNILRKCWATCGRRDNAMHC